MKDPLSTLSNIPYLILAIIVCIYDPLNQLLIGSLVFLAAASFLHHYGGAEANTVFHKADEAGIYVVMGTLIIQSWNLYGVFMLAAFLLLAILLMRLEQADLFRWTPALSVAVIIGLFVYHYQTSVWIVLGSALVGALFRLKLENTDFNHAIWHLVSCVSLGFAWYTLL